MWPTVVFSLCLLAVSACLISSHLRALRSMSAASCDERARRFGRDQFRRRTTASDMIGLIGLALMASPRMVDPVRTSFWLYWSGILLAVVAIALLAVFDLVSTRVYFSQIQRAGLAEQAALKAELARLMGHRGNGDHR